MRVLTSRYQSHFGNPIVACGRALSSSGSLGYADGKWTLHQGHKEIISEELMRVGLSLNTSNGRSLRYFLLVGKPSGDRFGPSHTFRYFRVRHQPICDGTSTNPHSC
jgi:hypothetical protein